jgi:hypothetical protein
MQPDTSSARARIERLCLALPKATDETVGSAPQAFGQHVGYKVRGAASGTLHSPARPRTAGHQPARQPPEDAPATWPGPTDRSRR